MKTGNEREWYRDWFGEDYLRVYSHRDATEALRQVDFIERILSLQRSDHVLDLGCGNGRHANEMARRSYHVTGLDFSQALLSRGMEFGRKNRISIRFVQGDMRYLPFCRVFDAVVSFFTTFGYFESDSENLRTLQSMRAVLKPGGKFVQDYLNKDQVIAGLVPRDRLWRNGLEIIQERRYNRNDERIEKKITLIDGNSRREYFESVRLYGLSDLKALLRQARLVLDQTYGDFDGRQFDAGSPRLILVGHREPS